MTRQRKGLIVSALVVTVGVLVAGMAIAQSGSSPESPEDGVRGEGVPKGPFVDFCPTREQTASHFEAYGFDYKPTVACNAEGEVPPPEDPAEDDAVDAGLSNQQACEADHEYYGALKPAPDQDGDPTTIEYERPDGSEGLVMVATSKPESWKDATIRDFADTISC